ncbi:MAG TPA: cupin domain-containing protein [Conexibacter sp.]|nr:cupin domain-containing protein [Conexibacter sp.]
MKATDPAPPHDDVSALDGAAPEAGAVERTELVTAFGRRLHDLRAAKGMSMERLAEEAGLSLGSVSQLHRGIGNPSYVTIAKLARALGVPLSAFFEAPGTDDVVVRRDARKRFIVPIADEGMVCDLLVPDLDRAIEATWVELPPGMSTAEAPFQHKGEKLAVVLGGELEVHLGEDVHVLEPGDSIAFRSTIPHWFRNPADVTTQVIWVTVPPSL